MNGYEQNEKQLSRYMRRRFSGGRSAFARAVDYITLRGIILIVAYLVFLPRFSNRATVWLLSAITLALFMLLLHVIGGIRYERFCKKEFMRVRKELLLDRLLLLDMQEAIPLVSSLCPADTAPVILQRALPVDANALLAIVRTHRGCGKLHVFSCTPYDLKASAFAARTNGMLVLHEPTELMSAAQRAGMHPPDAEVAEAIRGKLAFERARRHSEKRVLLPAGSARKYAALALLLMGMSFATGYALYYRLLAVLCMTIAAYCVWKGRAATSA